MQSYRTKVYTNEFQSFGGLVNFLIQFSFLSSTLMVSIQDANSAEKKIVTIRIATALQCPKHVQNG